MCLYVYVCVRTQDLDKPKVIVMYDFKIQIMMIKCALHRGIYPNPRKCKWKFNVKSQDLVMHYNLRFINMQF